MAFLDNSGDIILDAVLTDHGRKQLAKGDGSFEITMFALADDEVDYGLYNKNHASGSAYFDLEILQIPVLEAFTDNAASCKNKLLSFDNLELLFLPVLKLNQSSLNNQMHTSGSFYVAVDSYTEDSDNTGTNDGIAFDTDGTQRRGILLGENIPGENLIRVDQGLDTTEISARQSLGGLTETEYTVQMDDRLGSLISSQGNMIVEDYVDDDNQAFYTISVGDEIVSYISDTSNSASQAISGPRGTMVSFGIKASNDLNTSTFLFETLGSTQNMLDQADAAQSVYYIDSLVRITGVKTGYSLDIPVRFVKYKS